MRGAGLIPRPTPSRVRDPAAPRAGASARSGSAHGETFERIRDNPPWLAAFLRDMPKGGDIHSHLTGAIYAESYIRWAVEDGLCLERQSLALVAPPCEPTSTRIPAAAISPTPRSTAT